MLPTDWTDRLHGHHSLYILNFFIIGYWDTRKGSQPVEVTPIEKSHRDPIFNVKFIQSKTGTTTESFVSAICWLVIVCNQLIVYFSFFSSPSVAKASFELKCRCCLSLPNE